MGEKKEKIVVIVVITIFLTLSLPAALSMYGIFTQPVIVRMGDDFVSRATADYLSHELDRSCIIEAHSSGDVQAVASRAWGAIFYVGHGADAGIVSDKGTIEWSDLADAIEGSPSTEHMVVACNSSNMEVNADSKTWIVFPGEIDAQIAADVVLALHFIRDGAIEKTRVHSQLAMRGYFMKVVLGLEESTYLRGTYDPGGGGSGPSDYDFLYRGVYFSAYNNDPSNEVFYDHPSYASYYRLMGVGAPDVFSVGSGDDLIVDHVDRATVDLWKLGGLLSLAELLFALGIAAALSIFGIEVAPVIIAFAALLGVLGFAAGYIAEALLEDELGAGWVFYKDRDSSRAVYIKLGMSWWFWACGEGVVLPFPCDGRFIR